MQKLSRQAKLRIDARASHIDYRANRGLRKDKIAALLSGQYLNHKQNIILTGASGFGKTYLACALARAGGGKYILIYKLKDTHNMLSAMLTKRYDLINKSVDLRLDRLIIKRVNMGDLYMHFEAHGNGDVFWQDDILYVMPQSVFNLEGTLIFNEKIENTIRLNPIKSWCRFEVFKCVDTLVPMSAIPGLVKNLTHSKNNGCKLVCVVSGNAAVRDIIKSTCKAAILDSVEFKSIEDAQNYVRSIM